MAQSIEQDTDYVKSLGHKIGSGYDFIDIAKTMLTSRTRGILHQLQDFEFTRHTSYNLPAKRLRYLNKLVQKQIHDILSWRQRAELCRLIGFHLTRHQKYNLPEEHLHSIEKISRTAGYRLVKNF